MLPCIQAGALALSVVMRHVHDAKQECGSAQQVTSCLFILLFDVAVVGLLYETYPDWNRRRFTVLSRPRPYLMG